MNRIFALTALFLALAGPAVAQQSFTVERVAEGVYAALATPGGAATSNAFFVVGDEYVVAGGAHLTAKAVADLTAAVAATTSKPIRYFLLAHHHQGYTGIDFDFPHDRDVLMSWQAWKALQGEVRDVSYPVLFFSEGLTLKLGGRTLILNNLGKGHSRGDVIAFVPEAGVLFAGDLLYVDSVGYLGEGFMQEWVLALEFMQQLGAERIIPGYGPVSSEEELAEFKTYFKAFLTEVLNHIERGDTLEETLRGFSLPRYRSYQGYDRFLAPNLRRAYRQLQESFAE